MFTLSGRYQVILGVFFVALMALTCGHHFTGINVLPSASWAIFFLAGFYLSPRWIFPALLAFAAARDFSAINWGGVSSYCVSPAYALLLPAYGALWLAGCWYARHYQFKWSTLLPLTLSVIFAAAAATILSSEGFYWFSGRFTYPTFAESSQRFFQYFPQYLATMTFYITAATVCHIAFTLIASSRKSAQYN